MTDAAPTSTTTPTTSPVLSLVLDVPAAQAEVAIPEPDPNDELRAQAAARPWGQPPN